MKKISLIFPNGIQFNQAIVVPKASKFRLQFVAWGGRGGAATAAGAGGGGGGSGGFIDLELNLKSMSILSIISAGAGSKKKFIYYVLENESSTRVLTIYDGGDGGPSSGGGTIGGTGGSSGMGYIFGGHFNIAGWNDVFAGAGFLDSNGFIHSQGGAAGTAATYGNSTSQNFGIALELFMGVPDNYQNFMYQLAPLKFPNQDTMGPNQGGMGGCSYLGAGGGTQNQPGFGGGSAGQSFGGILFQGGDALFNLMWD